MSFPEALDDAFAVAMTVMDQLKQKQPKPGDCGVVACPACGGTVRWRTVGLRGRLRAECIVGGCFEMME